VDALKQNKDIEAAPKEYIKALFDNYATHFDEHLTQSLNYEVPEHCHTAITQLTSPPAKGWIIGDLGCGTGLCGPYFKPYAEKLLGIDLSSKMLAKAAEKKCYDNLIEKDLDEYLQATPNTFDCLIAADVFVYTGKLNNTFTHCHNALHKGGLFCFSTEIADGEQYTLLKSGRYGHSVGYIQQLADQIGFAVRLIETHKTRLQFHDTVKGLIVVLQKK
jgi:predicted TPR repeat methyltransferase